MKRAVWKVLGICFIATSAIAQDTVKTVTTTTTVVRPVVVEERDIRNDQTGLHFGIKFQPTITSLSNRGYEKNARNVSATVGYGYGGSLNYFFNNHMALSFEVIYSALSQEYADQQSMNRKVSVSYFDVPILFSVHTDYGRALNLNAAVGPQIGVLSGSKFSGKSYGETADVDAVIALDEVGIGIAYGAGIDFGLGIHKGTHLSLGVRGVNGLTNTLSAYIGLMFKL